MIYYIIIYYIQIGGNKFPGPSAHGEFGPLSNPWCFIASRSLVISRRPAAIELARHQGDWRVLEVAGWETTETAPRVRRHSLRCEDPDSQREVREKESSAC